jgi:hypothetical protein
VMTQAHGFKLWVLTRNTLRMVPRNCLGSEKSI